MQKKRGVTPIVATVLLIMLTVVVVAALTAFVVPFVKNTLNEGSECASFDSVFAFDESFDLNCRTFPAVSASGYNEELSFSVSRKNDQNNSISGFTIIFFGDGVSKSVKVMDGQDKTNQLSMLNTAAPKINIPSPGETRSYIYLSDEIYTKAQIKTVLKSGKVCEKNSDTIEITECI